MKRRAVGFFAVLLGIGAAAAAWGDDIMDKLVNAPSVKSWHATGLSNWPEEITDPAVTGGTALRFAIKDKGANPWSVSADTAILKPVNAGDVILVAFWARAVEPIPGQTTAFIPGIRVQDIGTPYGAFAQDQASVTSQWAMYYASGVADKNYKPGTIKVTLQLAAAKQTIDLGPVFVIDFGPNYDKTKLPHNKPVAVAAVVTPAGPAPMTNAEAEQRFAAELAKIRASLPAKGALINDPSVDTVGTYGADQHKEVVPAADLPGGNAVRVTIEKAGATSYASGTSSPLTGAIRKGDTVFIAFYARCVETDGASGVISSMRAQLNQSPWFMAVETSAVVPKGTWKLFTFSGIAQADLPAGLGMLSAQISAIKQVLDFGPAFVLNLGPGVSTAGLPKN